MICASLAAAFAVLAITAPASPPTSGEPAKL
jgi:hypothetical protein